MNIKIKEKDIFIKLLYFILFLLLANIAGLVSKYYFDHGRVFGLVRLFDLDQEKNIPTFYSSLAIFSASVLLLIIALTHKKQGDSYLPWVGLSVIFLFLSLDEIAQIHDNGHLTIPIRERFNTSGLLYFSWVIPYGIAVGVFAISYLKFLLNLPRRIMILFITSGLVFISGAIGIEMLGGRHFELYGNDLGYAIYYTLEEFLEMLGIATFIYTLLLYISFQFKSLTISISE